MVSLFSPPPNTSSRRDTQRVLLRNISWQTYQALLSDMGDHRSSRLAYDRGTLEITMPSDLHEFIKHLLERIIIALTEELNLKVRGVGSVTLNREDLQRGVEPDSGFYIQNASQIRGRKLDLVNNPPPDLVVEVDITNPSTRRLKIYQSLQIPEFWRCTEQAIEIKHLQNGEYVSCEYSLAFPMVSAAIIQQFLEQGKDTDDDNTVIRSLRSWIQQQQSSR
ncbi:Uma2 family endonuclease [Oculatella sp. LEGE 06141]|uniref:Uma2 family endonuclease n=1 Tax=Oculatella sp. LEGE 06141 TaxID=1828648 RepID=UPI0018803B7C|nr:Uma2 family endonuclease [Oculatella sp. LEGE 06141]MBE9182436.1 Uma2 family endonuclease [Oculatella sp. LEGE 06141]